jgi:hypothetical protein
MPDALRHAGTLLDGAGRSRDECWPSPRSPSTELPDVIALAHRVRLAYCGAEVELGASQHEVGACGGCVLLPVSRYSTDIGVTHCC